MLPQPVPATGDAPSAPLSRSDQVRQAALCDYLVRLAEDGKRVATIRQARAAIITVTSTWPSPPSRA